MSDKKHHQLSENMLLLVIKNAYSQGRTDAVLGTNYEYGEKKAIEFIKSVLP